MMKLPIAVTFALAAFLLPHVVQAQDLQSLIKNVIGVKQGNLQDLLGAIRSVAEASQGGIPTGVQRPLDADGKVVLYRTAWCGYCKQAAAHMQGKGIPFDERDIEKNPDYRAEYSRLGGKGPVPFIVFNQKTMLGFSPILFDQNYAEFQRSAPAPAATGAAPALVAVAPAVAPSVDATMPWRAGDTLTGKIAGVRVFRSTDKRAGELLKLARTDEVVFMGEEREGMLRVTSSSGEGWVDRVLVRKP